jgi:hypothetical protein
VWRADHRAVVEVGKLAGEGDVRRDEATESRPPTGLPTFE